MKRNIIIVFLALLAIIVIIVPLTSNDYKDLHDIVKKISAINISKTKKEKLKEKFTYTDNDKDYKVYYYGIDKVEFIINKNEFDMQKLFKEGILNRSLLEEYLDNEYNNGSLKRETLLDGGTNLYSNDNYSVIICHTKDGNKDIYFGIKDMTYQDEYCK